MQTFYNRTEQLDQLRAISASITQTKGQLSVVVGRRRVGKTRLLSEAFSDQPVGSFLYLFISRKSESALVEEFTQLLQHQLNLRFFTPTNLLSVFEFLFDYAKTHPLTLVVDEFQDIERIDSSIFSGLQHLWDSHKRDTQLHWVCCGSLYSLMTHIFKSNKQPLLNRDDFFFKIQPLSPVYIKAILDDHHLFTPERMLTWWCLSGGIPKYLEWLLNAKEDTFTQLISNSSPLIEEGLHRLVEDFGSEHRSYFSILSAIALGNTTRARIESYTGIGAGPLLEKLEVDFDIIAKHRPIHAKENSRDIRYSIIDPFLVFWFHFIHANRSAVEMENYHYIRALIERDFATFSGKMLENLYGEILKASKQFNRIGSYWDAKGEHEIDIVAINDLHKTILVIEVKRQAKRCNMPLLATKTQHLLQKLNCTGYTVQQTCFSLENIDEVLNDYFTKSESQPIE